MNILFLNPNWYLHNSQYTASISDPVQPLEFGYSAALLRHQHNVKIYDAFLYNSNLKEIVNEIVSFKADVVILETAPTYLFWRCCPLDIELPVKICKAIRKRSDAKIIVIGPHGSVTPEWVIKKMGADFLIRGEPELALVEFINNNFEDTTPGLYTKYRDNGVATINDLTKLPLPAFELFDMHRYTEHIWSREAMSHLKNDTASTIEFSRGCPFNCLFCFRKNFRKDFRTKTADQAIEEIRAAKKYGAKYFYFIDETFNIPSRELIGFLDKLKYERISFSAQCKLDIMTEDILHRMADAGCVYIEWGMESYDKDVLKAIKKDVAINTNILSLADKIIKYNSDANDDKIYFYSPEIKKILNITNKKSPLKLRAVSIIPYCGTELYNQLAEICNAQDANPWEFAQRYVWYQNLYRLGIRFPFKLMQNIPFEVLSNLYSIPFLFLNSKYIAATISSERRAKKSRIDLLFDRILAFMEK